MWNGNRKPNVLIVEDDDDSRELLVEIISTMKTSIFQASTGLEAIEVLNNHRIDILVTDYVLGRGLTAEDVVERAGENRASFAILISGRDFDAPPRGFDIVMQKPVGDKEVREAMLFLWRNTDLDSDSP